MKLLIAAARKFKNDASTSHFFSDVIAIEMYLISQDNNNWKTRYI